MNIGRWKITCWLWSIVYKRWLWDDWHKAYWKPIRVVGWRTALLDLKGQRKTTTPCFWWFD